MFLFKKILSGFLYPLSLCLGILLLGVILLWNGRRQRQAKFLITLAAVILILYSYPAFPDFLLRPLERWCPPLTDLTSLQKLQRDPQTAIRWIVVLGGGHAPDPQLPAASQLGATSLARLVEGIRLYRALPGSKLLVSGGPVFTSRPEAETMEQVARSLGVPQQDIILEPDSSDTREQSLLLKPKLHGKRFILVTSASHMPRSLALFHKSGLNPIPAPAGHLVHQRREAFPGRLFPGSGNLHKAHVAWHEYLGLAWARLRGEI